MYVVDSVKFLRLGLVGPDAEYVSGGNRICCLLESRKEYGFVQVDV